MVGTIEKDSSATEEPSLYHIINISKRQSSRVVKVIIEEEGNAQTSADILKTFSAHFRKTFNGSAIYKPTGVTRHEMHST